MLDGTDSEVGEGEGVQGLAYRLCPRCLRAVPTTSGEHYCVNDGVRMLGACPQCGAVITSPYAHFCAACGTGFARSERR